MKKETILAEIKRTAEANGGVALGRDRFSEVTGIKYHEWSGKYWARWGDAVMEAGFKPNEMQQAYEDDFLLEKLAELAIKIGHIPVYAEMRMESNSNPDFPNPKTLSARFGVKTTIVKKLRDYCRDDSRFAPVREWCLLYLEENAVDKQDNAEDEDRSGHVEDGYVYLVRSGRFCKIGRSNSAGRREREIALQMPDKAEMKHVIRTDDPVGIEAYWHNRFADKRKNGEWFELSAEDVRVFKRRKFM